MTTPNQLPIDRAFVIGGETADGTTDTSYPGQNYGQNFTDSAVRSLFEIPAFGLGNMVEVFTNLLLRLPLEALKIFEPIIPGGVENFTDTLTAVNAIVSSLTEVIASVPMTLFQAFLDILSGNPGAVVEDVANLIKNGLDSLQSLIQSLLGMLGIDIEGTLLDQIFDLVDGFDEWFGDFNILQGGFDDLAGRFEDLIGQFFEAFQGAIPIFSSLDEMISAVLNLFQSIPFLNIGGVAGPSNIGDSVRGVIDQLVSGFLGVLGGSGASLADLFNTGQEISSRATLGQLGWDILGIRNNQNLNTGFLPTTQSNIGFDRIALQSVAPTVPITQSTALTAYHVIEKSGLKGVVSWQGYGISSITDCYINIYKMNTVTGVNTLVHASTNQFALLSGGATPVPVVYSIPTPIQTEPGEVYGVEIAVRGAGTHNVAGSTSWITDQAVYPRRYSSVRNSGTSAPPSSFTPTYGSNVPFVEFGVSAGVVDIPHSPVSVNRNTPGTTTETVPGWANTIEVIEVGAGGGGYVGSGPPTMGRGGQAGTWQTTTWVRGTHFATASNPVLSITVADGGAGSGAPGTDGGTGGTCSVTLPATSGFSAVTLSAVGGVGGHEWVTDTADRHGGSPGNITYGDIPYTGGLQQTAGSAEGNPPGGGGSGGNTTWAYSPGKKGAPGAVWIRFKQ